MKTKRSDCICACDECEDIGVWEITILRKYRSEFGKRSGPYCNHCLEEELEGVHTGGGLTSTFIKAIRRRKSARRAEIYIEEIRRKIRKRKIGKRAEKIEKRAEKYFNIPIPEKIFSIFTDDALRDIYSTLISKSWDKAKFFQSHQLAWYIVAHFFGVKDIEENGYGNVIYGNAPIPWDKY